MGVLISCCRGSTTESEYLTPDLEVKRRQQAEAAEKRIREQENRGVKDPQRIKEKAKQLEQLEKRQEEAAKHGAGSETLKWTVG